MKQAVKTVGSLMVLLACVSAVTFFGIRALWVPAQGAVTYTWLWDAGVADGAKWQYTPEDLRQMTALKTADWTEKSVEEFAKTLADWTDEDVFHQRADAVERLRRTYPEDGAEAEYLRRTIAASFGEASVRHYGGHCTQLTYSVSDNVVLQREADVFGDPYVVFQATAEYEVGYAIPDGAKLTVGERDRILNEYREAVRAFLERYSETELLNRKSMERKLATELNALDRRFSTEDMKLKGSMLGWYDAYGPET